MRLDPNLLLAAYCQGIFPMGGPDGEIRWYDPNPRAIIPLDEAFHVPSRLARTVRNGPFEVRADTRFRAVMEACAEPGREGSWITSELTESYVALHEAGFAHSVEAWRDGALVGGLYGVAIGGLFAGESMFSRERDASKVALVHLVERLRRGGFVLLDTLFLTEHLARFGACEISRAEYRRRLAAALRVDASFE
jgi:leucyl/phenylalanyl-tRNA--protein transferase